MRLRFLNSVLALAGVLVAFALPSVYAQDLQERVVTSKIAQSAWVIYAEPSGFRLVEASSKVTSQGVVVRTENEAGYGADLAAALLKTADNQVLSTVLKPYSVELGGFVWSHSEELERRRAKLEQLEREVNRLEGQLHLTNVSKRSQAGLGEVDKVLEEVEAIQRGTKAYSRALELHEQARRGLCPQIEKCSESLRTQW